MIRAAVFAVMVAARLGAQTETGNPDSARIVISDVPRFWAAFDSRRSLGAMTAFDSLYFRPATAGLRDFSRMRIGGAAGLVAAIARDSAFYLRIRAATLAIPSETTAVRAAFRRLHELYPGAVFPDVYFLIGRGSAAGTVSNAGILIGLEKLVSSEDGLSLAMAPAVVSHELVHYQQRVVGRTLLATALREGGADFLAGLATGVELNQPLHEWLRQHESEVWPEFEHSMLGPVDDKWMDAPPEPGWPTNLAYAVGYGIARCLYARSTDKAAAIRETIVIPDAAAYLAASNQIRCARPRTLRSP